MRRAEWQRVEAVTETYELHVGPIKAVVYRWDDWRRERKRVER